MDKKYAVVKTCIREKISRMAPNEKLPSERDLIDEFGFSRPTIQKALSELESAGDIYRLPRKGAFVSEIPLHKSLNKLKSYREELIEDGAVPFTKMLSFEIVSADDVIANKLKLQIGEKVCHVIRLRFKDGVPIIHDNSFFPQKFLNGITCEDIVDSIYGFVERNGLKLSMSQEAFDAVVPPREIASLLKIDSSEPVIKVDKIAFLLDGSAFEYTISHMNPKKYYLILNAYR